MTCHVMTKKCKRRNIEQPQFINFQNNSWTFSENFANFLQLSTSSLAIHGGAIFSAVSGWKLILISVLGPYKCPECYRLLGFFHHHQLFFAPNSHNSHWSDLSHHYTRAHLSSAYKCLDLSFPSGWPPVCNRQMFRFLSYTSLNLLLHRCSDF